MRSFEEIPDIAERIKRSKMELQESGFYLAPEWDSQSCCDQDYVNNFKKGWESRQTEVDELQRRNKMLIDSIKEQGQKLVYQNEVIETQAEKLLGLRDEKAELQKRVDAAFRVLSQLNALDDEAHKRWKREACMFSQGESNAYEHAVRLLEQALKGEQQ